MKAKIKCSLDGKDFKPGDPVPAPMEVAFRERGWGVEERKPVAPKKAE